MSTTSRRHGRRFSIPQSVLVIAVALLIGGCQNNAKTGALIGSGLGAATGAVIGNQSGETGAGAAIGTAVGAGTGYIVGNEMDKSESHARPSDPTPNRRQGPKRNN